MRFRCAAAMLLLLAGEAFGQTVTTLNLSTQGHNPDFSNFSFTRPISVGSALPATCQIGQLFFNTAAGAGQNMYACTQTNLWSVMGGFTLLPAGPNTLGGVVVPSNSALTVDVNGVLSVNVGTGPGTLAAGNDTRIANALQPTSQIPAGNILGLAPSATIDATNANNISTGKLNVSLFPSSISSNTTGNAATASALAATPKGCGTGQFAQSISATGTASCSQVAYSQLSGTPSLFNQSLQVGGRAQTQRANLNFAAGSNVTLTPSDNGTNTTTLTISTSGLQAPATPNSIVKFSTGSSTTAAQPSDIVATLGFTPQNASAINSPNGYAGLDANGLLLASEMPATISSNTNGTAAAATALSATPSACAGNQFAQGISANGNAICGTPNSTSGLPDPGANGLIKRTAVNSDAVASAGVDYYAPGTPINDADLPDTITSSITGNAATATKLATAPAGCTGGQFLSQIGPDGNPVVCGTAVTGGPSVTTNSVLPTSSTCNSAANVGSLYLQKGTGTGTPQRLFACSTDGATTPSYRWIPVTDGRVNVMWFGCKADSSTDDSGCFNNAVAFAKFANYITNWDVPNGAPAYLGANVYVPCGGYAIAAPIVLPRSGSPSDVNWSTSNGVVGLEGQNMACVALNGTPGTGFNGVTGIYITNPGSGYTSAPTITIGSINPGGCSTEPTAVAVTEAVGSGSLNMLGGAYLTSTGTCTTTNTNGMPDCLVSGGGGTGATCIVLGHAMVEWVPLSATVENGGTFQRTANVNISNVSFRLPNQDGLMAIHYQPTNYPISDGNCSIGTNRVCERLDGATFRNLTFIGSNAYQPFFILLSGDCNTCVFDNLSSNPSLSSGKPKYQSVLIGTDFNTDAPADESDGLLFGQVGNLACGGYHNGSSPCFVGRMVRSTLHDAQCDGIHVGFNPAVCYAFLDSSVDNINNLSNEGQAGTQVLVENSRHINMSTIGIGTPTLGFANFSFTGNTTSGSATISNVNWTAPLSVGTVVTGSGIPSGTTITQINTPATLTANGTITLSNSATATATSVSLTGNNVNPPVAGLSLISASQIHLDGIIAGNTIQWNSGSYAGAYRIVVDSNSYQNQLDHIDHAAAPSSEDSIANLGSNYMTYCTYNGTCGSGPWQAFGTMPSPLYPTVVSKLGACNSKTEGNMAAVTDSTIAASGNYGATVVGGGTNHVKVYCNASNWVIN